MSKREYWNCDLCGYDVESNHPRMTLEWQGHGEATGCYDLCIRCYDYLKSRIVENKPKEEP